MVWATTERRELAKSIFEMWTFIQKKRKRLPAYTTLEDAVQLIRQSKNIVVLVGAGISVSCGIPDFRSKGGFYETLAADGIDPPELVFDLGTFQEDPSLFYKYGGLLDPTKFKPSLTHRFLAKLDEEGMLLRNYTQNIDNLERMAGVKHLIHCHGSMGTATCTKCGETVSIEAILPYLEKKEVAYCEECEVEPGVLKPDVVFFGESLPQIYFSTWKEDMLNCDLMIVCGTSLKVTPVATMIDDVELDVPQILINYELVGPKDHFDVNLLGNCDDIFSEIAKRLGWDLSLPSSPPDSTSSTPSSIPFEIDFCPPNTTVFKRTGDEDLAQLEQDLSKLEVSPSSTPSSGNVEKRPVEKESETIGVLESLTTMKEERKTPSSTPEEESRKEDQRKETPEPIDEKADNLERS